MNQLLLKYTALSLLLLTLQTYNTQPTSLYVGELQLTMNLFNACCTDMSSMLKNQLFQVKQRFLVSHLHK